MGSMEEPQPVVGQFMHPFIDETTENDDPWQRNYGQPPKTLGANLVPRSYPLVDIRPLLANNSATDLLKSHGFGIVKHHSQFIDQLNNSNGELGEQAITEIYWPEVVQLVKDTTGANDVVVLGGALRQGKRAPEEWKFPPGLKQIKDAVKSNGKHVGNDKQAQATEQTKHKLSRQFNLTLAAPARSPHMDFTDQGARASIRHQHKGAYEAAKDVIAYEDQICADQSFTAESHEANSLIAEQYNKNGELGPRYAAYSIWRPLKKVERDPISLGSCGGPLALQMDNEKVYWPYLNSYKGVPELGGDFLKEFAMLGVNQKEATKDDSGSDGLKWYYVSGQEPDEVLFIKQFDSAALGSNAQHAPAPWHGSPEIYGVEGDEPRESLDIRVFAFW